MKKELELRMYFFVPYNISPIQQAIQAGHAALEYVFQYYEMSDQDSQIWKFLRDHKTWIILNGGTTRTDPMDPGTMQEIQTLIDVYNESRDAVDIIEYTEFREPDLNYATTALCFICDERVFNYEDYIDFKQYFWKQNSVVGRDFQKDQKLSYDELKIQFNYVYKKWTEEVMGGPTNVFLRELLKGKKLA